MLRCKNQRGNNKLSFKNAVITNGELNRVTSESSVPLREPKSPIQHTNPSRFQHGVKNMDSFKRTL